MPASPDEVAGRQLCMYGSAESYCGAKASVHVLATHDDPTMSCDDHLYYWLVNPAVDMHKITPACGIPGMHWIFSRDGNVGFCHMLGISDGGDHAS